MRLAVAPHPHVCRPQLQRQESSFRAFLSRPENRPLVEEQQRLEVAGALALQEREREARLRDQVGWGGAGVVGRERWGGWGAGVVGVLG